MLSGGVVAYRPGVILDNETWRIFVGALEVLWWFGAAWLATGFLRSFVVLGGKRESKLDQDLLAIGVPCERVCVFLDRTCRKHLLSCRTPPLIPTANE